MAEKDGVTDGRHLSALAALLGVPGISWRFMGEDGSAEDLGPGLDPGWMLAKLRGHPELVLAGTEPEGETEVRWAQGRLRVKRSGSPGALGGMTLRAEQEDSRVDRSIRERFLAAGAVPGALTEERRREWAATAFLSRLLDLLADSTAPFILEGAAGPAPYGLALQACLARLGRQARLVLLDEAGSALDRARLLAGDLGVTAEFLAMPISAYRPAVLPDLLLAVHACGGATLDTLALALELAVPRLILVPCCAPEGIWRASDLPYGEAEDDPCLKVRLDAIGLLLELRRQLRLAGYRTQTFQAYLRPWRTVELGLSAYLPPS